jgi:FAD/FMN-containing dehydrogenase
VAAALLVLELEACPFAVKSGGHAAFAGGSNIAGGVTIDLANLNGILVSSDQTQTSVGPGNRWSDVYSHLDPLGLSVIGGRVADIGVGGLTLGGGISFSGRYGLACDNVNDYQVRLMCLQSSNQIPRG